MDKEHALLIVEYYELYLDDLYPDIKAERRSFDEISHIKAMLPLMRDLISQNKIEKFMRWLGFIQGWLWTRNFFTIEDLANHNRQKDAKS